MKKSIVNYSILYLFPIISYHGYGWVGFDMRLWKLIHFITLPLLFVYSCYGIKKKDHLVKRLKWVGLAFVLSILSSFIVMGQDIILSYRAMIYILNIVFLLFLIKADFSPKDIEVFIWIDVLIYIALWLFGLYYAPEIIFGDDDDPNINENRGILRLNIANRGCISLAMFYAFNQWRIKSNRWYLLIALFCFVLIVLMLSRMGIVIAFVLGVFYILRNVKHKILYISFGLFLSFFVTSQIKEDSVLGIMISTSESEFERNQSGDKNVRLLEYEYFLFDDLNPITMLFGHGVPHPESAYGKEYEKTGDVNHFYGSDVGWAFLYYQLGFVGLYAIISLIWSCLMKPCDVSREYAKYVVVYFLICNIASYALVTHMIHFCVAIYLLSIQTQPKSLHMVRTIKDKKQLFRTKEIR